MAIVLLGRLEVDVVVLERRLDVGSEVARELRCRGRRIGACLVDQLKHVLFLIGRPPAREQLTAFQVLEAERSTELGPSHGDLRVFIEFRPVSCLSRPRSKRSPSNRKEIVLKGRSDFRKNSLGRDRRFPKDARSRSKSRARSSDVGRRDSESIVVSLCLTRVKRAMRLRARDRPGCGWAADRPKSLAAATVRNRPYKREVFTSVERGGRIDETFFKVIGCVDRQLGRPRSRRACDRGGCRRPRRLARCLRSS